jgi:hypothetical protein
MPRVLKALVLLMGVACTLIGIYHFALGISSVPGETAAGATVDSRERFYNAIFIGYGLAWVWAWRQDPLPKHLVHALTWIFLLGGVGRVVSLVVEGRPHWFQLVLTAVELVVPFLFFWLLGTSDRRRRRRA